LSPKDKQITVLVVDDHALFRAGVTELLSAEDDVQVVAEAENGVEAAAMAER
jgi:DNA-binding NarL/FixJ family response regulator